MKSHEEIMSYYELVVQELERKEIFRKSLDTVLYDYEFTLIKNIFEIEEKTDRVLKDSLIELAIKSVKKTDLYYFLNQGNTEALISLIEGEQFQYKLYYIDQYNNLMRDIVTKYWNPDQQAEKLVSLLIKKGMEISHEKTIEICLDIKKWYEYWAPFFDKQILFYKLEEKLEHKLSIENTTKITKI